MNLFTGSSGRSLKNHLQWLNEPVEWRFNNGIEIIAPPKTDFFNDPEGPSFVGTAPYLYAHVDGDFEMTARININMTQTFDAGCLMVMADSKNWAKLGYENWLNEPSIVSVVTRTVSDDCPSLRIGVVQPYLKILRSGNCFGFHYSLDEKNWTIIRFFSMDLPQKIKAGIVAQCPIGTGCKVRFELLDLITKKIPSAKFVSPQQ